MARKKKTIERVCKNCKLYDTKREVCSIIVLHEGKKLNVPMEPEDACLYETEYFDPTTKAIESFTDEIKEVKMWVENDKGEKTDGDGVVKIEYPDGFFGEKDLYDTMIDDDEIDDFVNEINQEINSANQNKKR